MNEYVIPEGLSSVDAAKIRLLLQIRARIDTVDGKLSRFLEVMERDGYLNPDDSSYIRDNILNELMVSCGITGWVG